jgi:uncharacterized protein with HEPN domain
LTREIKLYLEDIFNAIKEIEEFMKGLSFDDFSSDTKVIRAVTMDFIIIGEAAKHYRQKCEKGIRRFLGQKSLG